jgi:hypothetical protein
MRFITVEPTSGSVLVRCVQGRQTCGPYYVCSLYFSNDGRCYRDGFIGLDTIEQ